MVWLMIMQGLSRHFYYNADNIKIEIYTEKDKSKIQVQQDDFIKGSPTNKWSETFPVFSERISNKTNPEIHSLFTHNFSTTTENISISYTITLMDALSEHLSMSKHFRWSIYRNL